MLAVVNGVKLVNYDRRTAVEERQFEAICTRLLNAKNHVVKAKDWLLNLKSDKPKVVSYSLSVVRLQCPDIFVCVTVIFG